MFLNGGKWSFFICILFLRNIYFVLFFKNPFFSSSYIANVMTIWFSKSSDCDLSREYWVLLAVSFLNCDLSSQEMRVARMLWCYYLLLRHLEIYRKLYLESSNADWGRTLRSRNLKKFLFRKLWRWLAVYVCTSIT